MLPKSFYFVILALFGLCSADTINVDEQSLISGMIVPGTVPKIYICGNTNLDNARLQQPVTAHLKPTTSPVRNSAIVDCVVDHIDECVQWFVSFHPNSQASLNYQLNNQKLM